MLLLPHQTRFIFRRLPFATLLLIFINVAVYFGPQRGDVGIRRVALQMYANSMLPAVEGPRYEAWLKTRQDSDSRERVNALDVDRKAKGVSELGGTAPTLLMIMLVTDTRFARELRANRIVTPGDPEFERWRIERERFDAASAKSTMDRFQLVDVNNPWQFLTHQFIHADASHLLGNMLVLLLAGPFSEAMLGKLRFALAYVLGGAVAGLAHLAFGSEPLVGASGAVSATIGMVLASYGFKEVPIFYWIGFVCGTARIHAVSLFPVWFLNELFQWASAPRSAVAYGAHIAGLLAGCMFAFAQTRLRRAEPMKRPASSIDSEPSHGPLLAQARSAAARMDIRRASHLYRELIAQDPQREELLLAYFNVAMHGRNDETLRDACLRLLWLKGRKSKEELRKAFLQMGQPKVLNILPPAEQLRLVRRLVRVREDSTALRVIDRLLIDDGVEKYSRQMADCLLGLYTTYARSGLRKQAEDVKQRLLRHFKNPSIIGGIAPERLAPMTIRSRRAIDENNTLNVPTK